MANLKIVYRAPSSLKPYERNARTHSAEQIAQIARSIQEFGWTNPLLIDEAGGIIAGHGRLAAALELGADKVPTICVSGLTEAQQRALVIADNKLALNAGWDEQVLLAEIEALTLEDFDLSVLGFSDDELAALSPDVIAPGLTDEDDAPPVQADAVTKPGDVWICGRHRVMCGDSTMLSDVEGLMDGKIAHLLHADPPYGMGKQADGVANDNLYREDLDRFQMEWWATFRTFLADNASAYIWGNAPELWRLWYSAGLGASERLELRNEIVWDKKSIAGMAAPDMNSYPIASERCLFFQIGNQFVGNINKDDFPEAWEPIRAYMEGQAVAAGIKQADIERVCGCRMYGHWFTRSQFTLMPEKHYSAMASAFPGAFVRAWSEIKAEWARVRSSGRDVINGMLDGTRSYFDNAHEAMRDVWEFPRVTGEDRHGHATPKPVAMMERVMTSSLPAGGLCAEPFGGSGATLMGAEKTGRACYTMELQAVYCDVIVRRWQAFTGKQATLESTGQPFDELADARTPELAAA